MPTISDTKVWRAGLSNKFTPPSRPANTIDLPQVHRVGQHQDPQQHGQHTGTRLGGVEHLALVQAVGDQPTEGSEQEQGKNCSPVAMATSTPVPCKGKRMR